MAHWFAIVTFSSAVSVAPGDCSPSRSVVSKMTSLSVAGAADEKCRAARERARLASAVRQHPVDSRICARSCSTGCWRPACLVCDERTRRGTKATGAGRRVVRPRGRRMCVLPAAQARAGAQPQLPSSHVLESYSRYTVYYTVPTDLARFLDFETREPLPLATVLPRPSTRTTSNSRIQGRLFEGRRH